MKFKPKMLTLCCLPLALLTILSLGIGVIQFASGMYQQTKSRLKSSALAAMTLYNSQGYGDYAMKSDGCVWRGMNFNVSTETSVVDDLKEQTGVDITFFYEDTAVMTSICNTANLRWIGMQAGENIKQYTLEQGAQLWYRTIEIDQKKCHAYFIPVVQPGDGSVIGALMASIPADELDAFIQRYIFFSTFVSAAVLIVMAAVIYWYIGGLTKVLHNVRKVLLQVSEGNFSDDRLTLSNRKDEFGELAAGTDKLRIKISHLFDEIQNGMLRLTNAAETIHTVLTQNVRAAREMNAGVGQINEKANTQKSDTQIASDDVKTTREAIDQMLSQIQAIHRLSDHMASLSQTSSGILNELLMSSQNARDTVQEISEQVSVTNASAQQIKSVTEYITNIAEETNLLALNASIEAARAGDAGKGFAVVAQEIQKLAEESNNSAIKIGDNILSLVNKTDGIVKIIGTIETALNKQEDHVEKTKRIFDEINTDIIQITSRQTEMQSYVSSMNHAKDSMSEIISDLSNSALDNANLSMNAANVTEQMMHETENLETLDTDLTGLANQLDETLKSFLS